MPFSKVGLPTASRIEIRAAIVGDAHHLGGEILGHIVDDLIGAVFLRERRLRCARDGSDHARARGLGDLHRDDSDAARRGMHHHGLARPDVMRRMKDVPCGEGLDRVRRALIEADVVGNRDHLRGARHHVLGVGFRANRRDAHPDAEPVDAFADLLDDAGRLESRSIGQLRRLRVLALAEKRVGEVDADGAIANQHGAFRGLGRWRIDQLQNFGTAEFVELDLLHGKISSRYFSAASMKCIRSLPQNIASPTKKVGAPKAPRATASSVLALRRSLTSSRSTASGSIPSRSEHLFHDFRIAEVHAVGPHRAEHHRMIRGEASRRLRDDRAAHHANGAQRKERIYLHRNAVVIRPSHRVDGVVFELGGNRGRRRVVGSLEDRAEQDRLIDDAGAGPLQQRGQLGIGEVAERTDVVEEKFQRFCHTAASTAVSICNWQPSNRSFNLQL